MCCTRSRPASDPGRGKRSLKLVFSDAGQYMLSSMVGSKGCCTLLAIHCSELCTSVCQTDSRLLCSGIHRETGLLLQYIGLTPA